MIFSRARYFIDAVFRRPASPAQGRVDRIENGVLHGWVWNPEAPDRRLLVDLFVDGEFAGEGLANIRRDDLVQAGIGDGRHSFRFDLRATPFSAGERYDVYLPGAARPLPRAADLPGIGLNRPPAHTPRDYLAATFPARPGRSHDSAIAPAPVRADDGRLGRLFAAPGEKSSRGQTPSRYRELVRRRYDGAAPEPDFATSLARYLRGYALSRGRMRAPLSQREIAALNCCAAPDGATFAQRCFADMFAPAPNGPAAAEFQWLAYDSAAVAIEDCMEPTSDPTDDDAWALSPSMRAWLDRHPVLSAMPTAKSADRLRAWCAYCLFATTAPHLLLLAPRANLQRFLAPGAGGRSAFDRQCETMLSLPDATDLLRRAVAARQFDLDAMAFRTRLPSGARSLAAALPLNPEPAVDVQVIGPFSRALGVGESCRRLSRALATLDVSLRNCDYTLDHPNASVDASEFGLSPVGRARVTILHLNLDDAPTALAYCPDAFSDTRLIVYPYVETIPISHNQTFGLEIADEVFAATRFVAAAVEGPKTVRVVGSCVETPQSLGRHAARARAYGELAAPGDFVFLTTGDALSGGWRKNPQGAIRAFQLAFPNDAGVKLVIKTHSTDRLVLDGERRIWEEVAALSREDARIVVIDDLLDRNAYTHLIEGADCLVSLHRAEGLGYNLLEAMALGVPVVASDYSGSQDYCSADTCFLVPGRLTSVAPSQYPHSTPGQLWFEPDVEAAAQQMRRARDDGNRRGKLTARARALVESQYSTQAFAKRLAAALEPMLRT